MKTDYSIECDDCRHYNISPVKCEDCWRKQIMEEHRASIQEAQKRCLEIVGDTFMSIKRKEEECKKVFSDVFGDFADNHINNHINNHIDNHSQGKGISEGRDRTTDKSPVRINSELEPEQKQAHLDTKSLDTKIQNDVCANCGLIKDNHYFREGEYYCERASLKFKKFKQKGLGE